MKTENEFNAYLSKEFKKREPEIKSSKISDRMSIGIPDFLLWRNGKSCALEVKFVKELPKREGSKILSHKFDGGQITFLESIALTKNGAFGLVVVEPEKKMYLIDMSQMPSENRMDYYDMTLPGLKKMCGVFVYEYEAIDDLIDDIL